MARAMVLGLPCRLRCRRDPYFARVDLEPLPGWVHLSDAATRAAWGDWSYHVSLSRNTVDEAAWQRLCERWDGVEVVLAIDYITINGVAVLSWAGLGADADAWALYEQGEFGYKWRDSRFGLHVSM